MIPETTNHQILAELATIARTQAPELLQFGSLAAAHQYLRLYQVWRRHVHKGANVLDWGAGNGHFSYFLQRAGYRTTAFSFMDFEFERWLPRDGFTFVSGSEREPVRLPFVDYGSLEARRRTRRRSPRRPRRVPASPSRVQSEPPGPARARNSIPRRIRSLSRRRCDAARCSRDRGRSRRPRGATAAPGIVRRDEGRRWRAPRRRRSCRAPRNHPRHRPARPCERAAGRPAP